MNKNPKSLTDLPSQTDDNWKKRLTSYFSLLAIGSGIGWLVGLSVSPVISIVITSIIGSAAAIIGAVSGLDIRDRNSDKTGKLIPLISRSIDPVPIAALVIGLVIGSYFGIQTRTYEWLEPDISLVFDKWVDLGLSKKEVRDAMFKSEFPDTVSVSSPTGVSHTEAKNGVLFAIEIDECDSLLGLTGEELKRELATSAENPQLRALPEIIKDTDVLKELLVRVLCSES